MEPFIPGEYQKYTNNNGYTSPGAKLAETFSHFTWHHSGGCMQVTDLQGFGLQILTDPQIHSTCKGFFSRGNLGKHGMDEFFVTHCCNDLCHRLGLRPSPMQLGFDAVSVADVSDTASVMSDCEQLSASGKLSCELCFGLVPTANKQQLADIFGKHGGWYCQACIPKIEAGKVRTTCRSCQKDFAYSAYVIKTKGCEVPDTCEQCQRDESWMFIDP